MNSADLTIDDPQTGFPKILMLNNLSYFHIFTYWRKFKANLLIL